MKETLLAGLPALRLSLDDNAAETMCAFGRALLEQNRVMNLTAITQPQAVAKLHFLDSLALLNAADLRQKTVVDVGCGAGFPGVPLKIAQPSIRLTLLDSLGKRMNWLSQVLPQLGVEAQCVTARAEEYALDHREQFDVAVSRAVARLNILSELCLPLVRVGGCFLSMKGAGARLELEEAQHAIAVLGGRVEQVMEYPLDGAVHRVIVIRKVSPTPRRYPRRFAKIKQQAIV